MPLRIEGKDYDLPNVGKIKMYPISKVSQALTDAGVPRDVQTIRKWESRGVIPPAIFRHGQKRLFTQEQIDCIVRVALECGIKQGSAIENTDFVERVWEEMKIVNAKYLTKKK